MASASALIIASWQYETICFVCIVHFIDFRNKIINASNCRGKIRNLGDTLICSDVTGSRWNTLATPLHFLMRPENAFQLSPQSGENYGPIQWPGPGTWSPFVAALYPAGHRARATRRCHYHRWGREADGKRVLMRLICFIISSICEMSRKGLVCTENSNSSKLLSPKT